MSRQSVVNWARRADLDGLGDDGLTTEREELRREVRNLRGERETLLYGWRSA